VTLEEWRTKLTERTDKIKARIEEWKAGREAGASRTLRPQALAKQIREKGLVETVRARREAWRGKGTSTTRSSKEYKREVAIEGSPALKVEKGRVSIEA